jgi:hypothetical protein
MNNRKKVLAFIILLAISILGVVCFYNNKNAVHILKEYNSKTKATDISEYFIRENDTIFQGKFTRYNEKGIKIAEGQFLNNEPVGKTYYFYEDGKLKSIYYKKNSKITEEVTEYYPNGKVKRYIMFDPFGLEAFIARYDEQGFIKSYEGYPLMEIYQYPIANMDRFRIKTNQFLKVGDILKHKYLIANIPNAKRSFSLELLGSDRLKNLRTVDSISIVQKDYGERLTKKGINKIRAIVQYEFNNKERTVIKDTVSFEVDVH